MKKENTLKEMLMGIIIWGILAQVVLLIGFENDLYHAIGLWCGVAVAAGMAIHMKHSIEEALAVGQDFAAKRMLADTAKRMGTAALVIGVVFYFGIGNPLTVLLGIVSLKIAAYLQPHVHKKIQKRRKGD